MCFNLLFVWQMHSNRVHFHISCCFTKTRLLLCTLLSYTHVNPLSVSTPTTTQWVCKRICRSAGRPFQLVSLKWDRYVAFLKKLGWAHLESIMMISTWGQILAQLPPFVNISVISKQASFVLDVVQCSGGHFACRWLVLHQVQEKTLFMFHA